jgi:hypothetical protein
MERIALVNDVADCTSLKLERLVALGNVEIGTFSVRSIKSRGECGCMSSVLAYHVMEKVDLGEEARAAGAEEEYERVYGTVELRAADSTVSLVLATDRRHYANVPLTLKLNCKGPD